MSEVKGFVILSRGGEVMSRVHATPALAWEDYWWIVQDNRELMNFIEAKEPYGFGSRRVTLIIEDVT